MHNLLELFKALGPGGVAVVYILPSTIWSVLILILWHKTAKTEARRNEIYREDMKKLMEQAQSQHAEVRRMYENNVKLLEVQQRQAGALETLVVRNTETQTRLCDMIMGNQFCPMVRAKGGAKNDG